jgi:ketosteroid isomerase-like protein
MTALEASVRALTDLLAQGRSLEAMERFYAPDVTVFENRELRRAGKAQCLEAERAALALQPEPPRFKLSRLAVNEPDGCAFIESVVRFSADDGRPMRLEQISVQVWENGLIVEETFYYEGLIDEGDEDDDDLDEDEDLEEEDEHGAEENAPSA